MKKAFSIVELIIVIAVIGILAAILIPLMSNIIDSANAKSALADAKNTLTNYVAYCESDQKSRQDVCIIAEKAKKFYAFSCEASEGELKASEYNPIEAESLDEAADLLYEVNVLVASSENSIFVALPLPDSSDNVLLYEGYRLKSSSQLITLSKERYAIGLDETYTLVATTFLQEQVVDVTWESTNPGVATVNDGVVTPVAVGETEIIARCGDNTASCRIIVDEFIEFSGSMAELKAHIEDNADNALLLRLMANADERDNASLFPIVVPEDKIVRIDFSKKELNYNFTSDEHGIPAFVENNGGDFYIYCSGNPELDYGFMRIVAEGQGVYEGPVETETCGHLLANKNDGYVQIGNNMSLYLDMISDSSYVVYNFDGYAELLIGDSFNAYGAAVVRNDENGRMSINGQYSVCENIAIINYGVIESISGSLIKGDKVAIQNHGLIRSVSSGIIQSHGGIVLENTGRNAIIKEISGGGFYSTGDDETDFRKEVLVLKEGSRIESITGGKFSGREEIACDESSSIYSISGGEFEHPVPEEYLAPGKACVYDPESERYAVK